MTGTSCRKFKQLATKLMKPSRLVAVDRSFTKLQLVSHKVGNMSSPLAETLSDFTTENEISRTVNHGKCIITIFVHTESVFPQPMRLLFKIMQRNALFGFSQKEIKKAARTSLYIGVKAVNRIFD